jgi:putative FmdB family regulatory protein
MPTYEYACRSCGEHVEVVQSFRDDPLTTCPACGGSLRKVFGSIGVVFKGSGFYKTDSRPAAKEATAKDTTSTSADTSSTTSGSKDASASSKEKTTSSEGSSGSSSEKSPTSKSGSSSKKPDSPKKSDSSTGKSGSSAAAS